MKTIRNRWRVTFWLVLASAALAGCGPDGGQPPEQALPAFLRDFALRIAAAALL